MNIVYGIDLNNLDIKSIIEVTKLVIVIPVFLFWSLYDLITKTVKVKWQRSLIAAGILYNFIYLFIDNSAVKNNIIGFLVCYVITFLYSIIKKVFGFGEFGKGDIMYCAIVGLIFGTAVGVLTIILSFIIFDGLLNLVNKIFLRTGPIAVAFFPFITAALLIIIFFIGEFRLREWYNLMLGSLGVHLK